MTIGLGMPAGLLISVSNVSEIHAALCGGAQILDVKDPASGSLGAASAEVVRWCRRSAPTDVPVSAALGDRLGNSDGLEHLVRSAQRLADAGASILKIGLAATHPSFAERGLARLRDRVEVSIVAVAFADADDTDVSPRSLPDLAQRSGVDGAMLDTLGKRASVFEILGERALADFVRQVRARALLCGLAGSLALEELPRAAALGADVIGVRGAVCVGGRDGALSAALVARARAALEGSPPRSAAVSASRRASDV